MTTRFMKLIGAAAIAATSVQAMAQSDWGNTACFDPANTTPRSTDHNVIRQFNQLFHAATGLSGTATYGDTDGDFFPCFATSITLNLAGGFGFMSGSVGSVQDQNPADPADQFIDDFLLYTFGMPNDPARPYSLATTVVDGTRTLFTPGGFWTGLSNRYYRITSADGDIGILLTVQVIGDAAKLTWDLTNNSAETTHNVGLWFGQTMGMLTADPSIVDTNGASMSFQNLGTTSGYGPKLGFVELPYGRPPLADVRFNRLQDPVTFPQWCNFLFGQSASYGLHVDNGPTPQTMDQNGNSDATQADEFVIGKQGLLLGDTDFADGILPDTSLRNNTAYIQKFDEQPVLPTQTRTITQYFRSPWGNGNYSGSYTAVADAPQLVASDPNGFNGLSPNTMTIRVYVDNANIYGPIGNEFPLNNVAVSLSFPTNQLSMANGDPSSKIISVVPARNMSFVDFEVEADGVEFGDIPYRVDVVPQAPAGAEPKVITGTIKVSTTPNLNINFDANMVTNPWTVDDSSWEAILGLSSPADFRAFRWDPVAQGYVPSTSSQRGFGAWIVANADFGPIQLQGNPTLPTDVTTGAPNITLKAGWNMIGNPYPYPVSLGQIIGVPGGVAQGVRTWAELVQAGFVGSALATYDETLGEYSFIQGGEATLQPHLGYWIYLNTQQDLTLSYPAVFARYVPNSPRRAENVWPQNDKQWRLQLAVRSDKSLDSQNFIGVVRSKEEQNLRQLPEIPMSPIQNVGLGIDGQMGNTQTRMSQAYVDKTGRRTWTVRATTTEATTATITWPNLSTVPNNMRFRITDVATNTTRDMRQTSGYSFTTNEAASREFKIEMIPGGTSRAVIGNVLVSRPSRDRQAPFTIKYTLSNDATTSIRVLSGAGKEIYTVSRGRADRTGENEATWAMRDNANRLVAPGTYRVEILAETPEGDRARKIIPVNVIR